MSAPVKVEGAVIRAVNFVLESSKNVRPDRFGAFMRIAEAVGKYAVVVSAPNGVPVGMRFEDGEVSLEKADWEYLDALVKVVDQSGWPGGEVRGSKMLHDVLASVLCLNPDAPSAAKA